MKNRKRKAAQIEKGDSVADLTSSASQKSFADGPHSNPKLHRVLEHAAQILKKKPRKRRPGASAKKRGR
jgi:hypothetical protein